MRVEICANSYPSAIAAQNGGAHRIELCTALSVGGLTPSRDLIRKTMAALAIPVHVLVRPRSGDFCYSEEELATMLQDIEFYKEVGCSGVVSGVLTSEGDVDAIATKRLINMASGMHFTFHRAFDEVLDPQKSLLQLIDLGADRILTSGQQPSAIKGLSLLKKLLKISEATIEIMPGAGITSKNAMLFKEAGFPSIHLSATLGNPEGHSDQKEIESVVSLVS